MTLPAYVFGLLYALLLGSLFHVWRDGGAWRLLLFLALSILGAAAGQWVGTWLKWNVFPVGGLNLAAVTLGSLLLLGAGYWLSLVEIHSDEGRKRKV